jgi:hypothetical protein
MTNLAKGATVSVDGLGLTIKAMRELGADNKVLSEPGYQAAMILIRAARPLVPKKSGALLASVRPKRSINGAAVKATAVYANPIHWGWAIVGANHKGSLPVGAYRNIKPQPFFSEALGYTANEILDNYEKLMRKAIDNLPGGNK